MKVLYIDCSMGAAGDMLTAAMAALLPDPQEFLRQIQAIGLPNVEVRLSKANKSGIQGNQFTVLINGVDEEDVQSGHEHPHDHHYEHDHQHACCCAHDHSHDHSGEDMHEASHGPHHCDHPHDHEHEHEHEHEHHHSHPHTSMTEIEAIVKGLNLDESVKRNVMGVYRLIANAESKAHGVSVTDIHFHEVGTLDAIVDISSFCLLMHMIKPDKVYASPIHVGAGTVCCAHGVLPVPAPATAYLLEGVPIYGGAVQGELCTPTGAALLRYFVDQFGQMPVMSVNAIGYGIGKKDFTDTSALRVMVGTSEAEAENVCELECNVDDMTAEQIGFAMEQLFRDGAVEVFTSPVGMKKNRPGTLLQVLCRYSEKEILIRSIFKNTSTIGLRCYHVDRVTLDRKTEIVQTQFGPVRRKISSGYGVTRSKLEFDDLARIAQENDLSLENVVHLAESCREE